MNSSFAAKWAALFMMCMNMFLADAKIIFAEQSKAKGPDTRGKALSLAPQDEIQPDIYGNWVAWKENSSGKYNIFLYNLKAVKGRVVSSYLFDQSYPLVFKDKLVWLDLLGEQISPIQLYDITTRTKKDIGKIFSLKGEMAVCKDNLRIVWQDMRNDNWDIYMYDLVGNFERPVCVEMFSQTSPHIDGDKIVWQDMRNDNWDIYMYDLSEEAERPICKNDASQTSPVIYGDKVVWQDMRNGNWDIYMYDLSEELEYPICVNTAGQVSPVIYGDKIVWQDLRNGNGDIYMYDLSKKAEIPICTNPAEQRQPAIYDDKIVWADKRTGNWDIYMYDLKSEK